MVCAKYLSMELAKRLATKELKRIDVVVVVMAKIGLLKLIGPNNRLIADGTNPCTTKHGAIETTNPLPRIDQQQFLDLHGTAPSRMKIASNQSPICSDSKEQEETLSEPDLDCQSQRDTPEQEIKIQGAAVLLRDNQRVGGRSNWKLPTRNLFEVLGENDCHLELIQANMEMKEEMARSGVGDLYLKIGTQLVKQLEEYFYCKDEKGDNLNKMRRNGKRIQSVTLLYSISNEDVETMDLLASVTDGVGKFWRVNGKRENEDGGDGGSTVAADKRTEEQRIQDKEDIGLQGKEADEDKKNNKRESIGVKNLKINNINNNKKKVNKKKDIKSNKEKEEKENNNSIKKQLQPTRQEA
ncbi:hypothetical protein PPACK8108_LOCUS21461 [Phakopsora pachyrhizi]|uniref:Uncharacterized protein n=1 Tax=Phakopsora pachyrhizi TaxID=170000 RepID=A0AAV0BJM2_PHAPC|nr:hypothetical protein PPACK8108_LOCUS21461 [Phakopsora pachyrhizi]